MKFSSLDDWLSWQEGLNPREIDLGLERVAQVWQALSPADLSSSTMISIAGTNGKGSTVALFEAIFKAAGYTTGSYTSPHLLRYNERIRLDGRPVDDQLILDAFEHIDEARGQLPLTYFEFGTLAALNIFAGKKPDVVLLEVGLGGRLDAVNIIDADLAVITSIDIDHQEWLGNDRETIGREKAGIFRKGRPAVFSATDMPASIAEEADRLQLPLYVNGLTFCYKASETGWTWKGPGDRRLDLPLPNLPGEHQLDNASGVIMALQALAEHLSVDIEAISRGLKTVRLTGRQQIVEQSGVQWVLDVAHNPHAVEALKQQLQKQSVAGRTLAVLGMLKGKDAQTVLDTMNEVVDEWHFVTLQESRGLAAEALASIANTLSHPLTFSVHPDVPDGLKLAVRNANRGDRVLVLGSFHTVAEALESGMLTEAGRS